MANRRKDRDENVRAYLTLDVGGSVKFPLNMYNAVRNLQYTNPDVLAARADGKVYSVKSDLAGRCVVLTRTA